MTPQLLWTGFLALLVLSPLPLGSNRPLAWSMLGLAMGGLMLGWARLLSTRQLRLFWRPALWAAVAVYILLLAWIVVQTSVLPLPGANPLWHIAGIALGKDLEPAIGLDLDAAATGFLKLLTYGAAYWLALQMGRDPGRAWQALRWLAWASGAYAAYGLINYFAGNDWLLWYERWAYPHDVTSTFVNRNHFATFAALGMLAATALSIRAFKSKWRVSDRSLPRLYRGVDALIGRSLAYLIVALVVAMAWLQSHSRLGFAAGAAGMLVFMIVLYTSGTIRSRWTLLVTFIMVPLFLILVSGDGTLARLGATQEFDRAPIFTLVTSAIGHAPWVGYGYGSFASAFQMFRDTSIPPGLEYTEAHSTYLELAFELGVPATVMLVLTIGWLAGLFLVGAHRRNHDRVIPALAFAATVIVALHSVADFSLQVPAVAFTYAGLLGLGCSQTWPLSSRAASGRTAGSGTAMHSRPIHAIGAAGESSGNEDRPGGRG